MFSIIRLLFKHHSFIDSFIHFHLWEWMNVYVKKFKTGFYWLFIKLLAHNWESQVPTYLVRFASYNQ